MVLEASCIKVVENSSEALLILLMLEALKLVLSLKADYARPLLNLAKQIDSEM